MLKNPILNYLLLYCLLFVLKTHFSGSVLYSRSHRSLIFIASSRFFIVRDVLIECSCIILLASLFSFFFYLFFCFYFEIFVNRVLFNSFITYPCSIFLIFLYPVLSFSFLLLLLWFCVKISAHLQLEGS